MRDSRLAQAQINNPYLPTVFPVNPRFETLIGSGWKAVDPVIDNHYSSIMLNFAVVETKIIPMLKTWSLGMVSLPEAKCLNR